MHGAGGVIAPKLAASATTYNDLNSGVIDVIGQSCECEVSCIERGRN